MKLSDIIAVERRSVIGRKAVWDARMGDVTVTAESKEAALGEMVVTLRRMASNAYSETSRVAHDGSVFVLRYEVSGWVYAIYGAGRVHRSICLLGDAYDTETKARKAFEAAFASYNSATEGGAA